MSTDSTGPKTRRVGRRSIVRGGVWSVPVVTIAAAAPALAASGHSDLHTSSGTNTKDNAHQFKANVTLRNTGAVATTGLQVQITVTGGSFVSASAPGWSFSGNSGVSSSQIAAGGSLASSFTIVTSNNPATITLNFTTSNGGTFTYTFTPPKS